MKRFFMNHCLKSRDMITTRGRPGMYTVSYMYVIDELTDGGLRNGAFAAITA